MHRQRVPAADTGKLWVGRFGRVRQTRAHPDLAAEQRQVLTLLPPRLSLRQ